MKVKQHDILTTSCHNNYDIIYIWQLLSNLKCSGKINSLYDPFNMIQDILLFSYISHIIIFS